MFNSLSFRAKGTLLHIPSQGRQILKMMFLFPWWDYVSCLENKLLQGAVTVQLQGFLVELLRIWAAMHATVPARGAGDFQPQVTAMSLISPSIWQKLRYPQPNPSLLCYKHPKHPYIIYIYTYVYILSYHIHIWQWNTNIQIYWYSIVI